MNINIELTEIACPKCGMVFFVPTTTDKRLRQNGGSFFCPYGHAITYGLGDIGKLRKELAAANSYSDELSQRLMAERDKVSGLQRKAAPNKKRKAAKEMA